MKKEHQCKLQIKMFQNTLLNSTKILRDIKRFQKQRKAILNGTMHHGHLQRKGKKSTFKGNHYQNHQGATSSTQFVSEIRPHTEKEKEIC